MKQKISELQKEIDKIDETLINCLDKRADLVIAIGKIKKENNLPIFNKDREKEIFRKIERAKNNRNILRIFKKIIEESRKIQGKIR